MDDITSGNFKEFLIEKKLATDAQIKKAEKQMEENPKELLDTLIEMGSLKENDFFDEFCQESMIPPVHIWRVNVDPGITEIIPRDFAVANSVFPLSKIGDILTVAMAHPWKEEVLMGIRDLHPNTTIALTICPKSDLDSAVNEFYGDNYEEELKDIVKGMEDPGLELMDEMDEDAGVTDTSILLSLTDQEPVVRLVNSILREGVKRGASDIFVEPQLKSLVIRYRVDGVLQDGPHPPKSMHQGVVSRMKIMSNLDIAEQRLPQDGRVKIKVDNRWVEFRLSTIPSYFGEKACLRILDPESMQLDLSVLGIDEANLQKIKHAAAQPYGMILICGPTGSGKTTTLYSVLNHIDCINKNLITVEDPVEYHMDGINQVNVKPEVNLTFAAALKSILRQDPDTILIGEIRDKDTLNIGIKAALTGHMVLSTLHTNTAAGSITRLINMDIEPFLITSSVLLVGSQRLARKLCEHCKESVEPTEDQIKAFKLEEYKDYKLFAAKGCDECHQSGYRGRLSVVELLPISAAIKELIVTRAPEYDVKKIARKEGMKTLRENAVMKACLGLTSLDEVVRVTMKDED